MSVVCPWWNKTATWPRRTFNLEVIYWGLNWEDMGSAMSITQDVLRVNGYISGFEASMWKELVSSSILKRHLDHTGMENDDDSLFLLSLRFLHWPPFEISNYFGIQIETLWIILFLLIARASIIVGTTIRNIRWFWYIDWYQLCSVEWFCRFIKPRHRMTSCRIFCPSTLTYPLQPSILNPSKKFSCVSLASSFHLHFRGLSWFPKTLSFLFI